MDLLSHLDRNDAHFIESKTDAAPPNKTTNESVGIYYQSGSVMTRQYFFISAVSCTSGWLKDGKCDDNQICTLTVDV